MKRYAGLALAAIVVVAGALLTHSYYYLNIAVFTGLNVILAMGLNLLLGYAGQVSLGHAAFYGLGAYCAGILSVNGLTWLCHQFGALAHAHALAWFFRPLLFVHWPAWLCWLAAIVQGPWPAWLSIPMALLLTAAVAYLIGLPTLRLKGHYLALATLGFGIIVQILLVEMPSLTGGPMGLIGIPFLKIGPLVLRGDRSFAILVWLIILVIQAGVGNLRASRSGRALLAIHANEVAAASLGVDTGREKRAVFVLSAALAALAGSLYAYYINFISPETFGFGLSVQVLTMAVVGGLGSLWGPVLGAVVLTVLPEVLRPLKEYDTIFYGAVLILAIAFLPEGLAAGIKRLWAWTKEQRDRLRDTAVTKGH